jgi:phosphoenolpyruvate carboxykinase (GTP)
MNFSSVLNKLPVNIRKYVGGKAELCQPDNIVLCDGSAEEFQRFMNQLVEDGVAKPLAKLENW